MFRMRFRQSRMPARRRTLLVIILLAATPCFAQPAPQQQADPKACAHDQRLQLGDQNGPSDRSQQPLSDKLDRTQGVLCPPDVDPQMAAPAPDVGKTPVIPPPGSPGGNPSVQPK
jgi:hypothetical protein